MLAVLALVCLGTVIVLGRAVSGLPERIPVEFEGPTAEEGTGSTPQLDTPNPAAPASEPEPETEQSNIPGGEGTAGNGSDDEVQADESLFPELEGDQLRSALQSAMEAGHRPLSYRKAREAMYWIIDNRSGTVTTVYAMKPLPLDPGEWPRQQDLNCEHVWPQSKGSKRMPMKTDLFHLRPAVPRINSTRSNHPFGVPVTKGNSDTAWHVGPDEDGDTVFMPPPDHRGDISRSMFYFSVRYGMNIDEEQEEVLRTWHREDPVDEQERKRVDLVEEEQGNRNLFVDDPEVVERITDF